MPNLLVLHLIWMSEFGALLYNIVIIDLTIIVLFLVQKMGKTSQMMKLQRTIFSIPLFMLAILLQRQGFFSFTHSHDNISYIIYITIKWYKYYVVFG